MRTLRPDFRILRQVCETFLIGGVGGTLLNYVGFPAGLISGSVLAVTAAALMGRKVGVPLGLTRCILILAGIALGATVTPRTLQGIANYPLSILILALATWCIFAATGMYLRLVHGWDSLSALFGASPGALAQMVALSVESGADLPGILIVQTVRVLALTVGLPSGLALLGLAGSASRSNAGAAETSAPELILLIAAAASSAFVLQKLRLPGGWLFGAMIGSGALHGAGVIHGGLPGWIGGAAMIGLGAVNGSRFAHTNVRILLGHIGAALGSLTVALVIATAFIAVAHHVVAMPPADVVIAYAPGAQDTMMLLALALHLDPVFVGSHHLARFLIVSFSIPVIARLFARPRA